MSSFPTEIIRRKKGYNTLPLRRSTIIFLLSVDINLYILTADVIAAQKIAMTMVTASALYQPGKTRFRKAI